MAVPFNRKWQSKDGSLHDTIWDAQGADKRYELEIERNKLIKEQNKLLSGETSSSNTSSSPPDLRTEKQKVYDMWTARVFLLLIIICGIITVKLFSYKLFNSLSIVLFFVGAFVSVIPLMIVQYIFNLIFRPKGKLSEKEAKNRELQINKSTNKIEQKNEKDNKESDSEMEDDIYDIDNNYDRYLEKAVNECIESGETSASFLQRKLKIGYSQAVRIVEQLETLGVISGYENGQPRRVLLNIEQWKTKKQELKNRTEKNNLEDIENDEEIYKNAKPSTESKNYYGMRFQKNIQEFCEDYNKALDENFETLGESDIDLYKLDYSNFSYHGLNEEKKLKEYVFTNSKFQVLIQIENDSEYISSVFIGTEYENLDVDSQQKFTLFVHAAAIMSLSQCTFKEAMDIYKEVLNAEVIGCFRTTYDYNYSAMYREYAGEQATNRDYEEDEDDKNYWSVYFLIRAITKGKYSFLSAKEMALIDNNEEIEKMPVIYEEDINNN